MQIKGATSSFSFLLSGEQVDVVILEYVPEEVQHSIAGFLHGRLLC